MRADTQVGLLGADERMRAMVDRYGPGGPLAGAPAMVTRWAPAMIPGGLPSVASSEASRYASILVDRWTEVVEDPLVDTIVVGTDPGARPEVIQAALEAGKTVWCPWPIAETEAAWGRLEPIITQHPGALRVINDLVETEEGSAMLTQVEQGFLGSLTNVYGAFRDAEERQALVTPGMASLTWHALDFFRRLTRSPATRVYAASGPRRTGGPQVLLLTLRYLSDVVVTAEIATGFPGALGDDWEVEATGTHGVFRIAPFQRELTLATSAGSRRLPWVAGTGVSFLEKAERPVAADIDAVGCMGELLALMGAIEVSLERGDVVAL